MKTNNRLARNARTLLFSLACCLPLATVVMPAHAAGSTEETVTIRNDGDNTYYEFRVNGELVEIKVQPKVGKPYYLVPSPDDDQNLMRRDNPDVVVPKWVIFRW
ncbi:DUF2782 domain-containing protein [Oceanobacter kriegii]|uniref:DUF2782 domain-containing protein n=1 Tax=Oceanobacter kriegii TaxID=64972 RepID=UPI00041CAD12|nr:DUF2782 domain-containing protein [Oceanobacter kriegii]